jgi:hypothetical protein
MRLNETGAEAIGDTTVVGKNGKATVGDQCRE